GARIIVAAAGKLAPRGTRAVADVEDRVEVRAGPAGLDRGCSGQVRGPLIDALRGAARRPARPRLRAAPAGRAAEGAATGRNHDRRRARSGAGPRRARRRGRGRSRRRGGGGSGGRGGGGGGGGGRGGSRGRPGRRRAARRGGRRRGGGCVAHGPHEGGAALAATPA